MAQSELKKVVVYATGGTIAGQGAAGKSTGYASGTLSAADLLAAVPGISNLAQIEAEQLCNINSDDMTDALWLDLANRINQRAQEEDVAGFVVTHGTDTMEETAYFLNLVVKTDKPVVLTGSMRPATATSADGPMNLFQAVAVAASEKSKGRGVLVVFSDQILSGREVSKMSTYSITTMSGGAEGTLGVIRDETIVFYNASARAHTLATEFDVAGLEHLPRVSIVYFNVDADPGLLAYAMEHSDGVVVAGAGAGEFSRKFVDVINGAPVPVVVSSRVSNGIITQGAALCPGSVTANNLSPQKAAVLLRLALLKTTEHADLVRMFEMY